MSERRFTTIGAGRYRLDVPDYATTFEADRLHWDKYELGGELIVRCELAGTPVPGALSSSSFNFSSFPTRHTMAKRLAARAVAPEVPWDDLVEDFCQRVLAAERTGEPAVLLADVPDPPADDFFMVDRLQIPKTVPSMFFGDGDSLKSTLALYVCGKLSQGTARCGFFDWELNRSQQKRRYRQMFGQAMPGDLVYVECARPILHEADRLARIVSDLHLDFAVFDSVVPACGIRPEDAEMASLYFRAIRTIGGPAFTSLHIAHITKGENGDAKPFGSAFWSNLVRQSWFVKASEPQPGEATTVGLYPRKHNLGPRGAAIGFAVSFLDDQISIRPTDLADVPELAEGLPLWQRMRGAVSRQPKTLVELAAELGAKIDTIDRTVRRKNGLFVRLNGTDGIARIALLARENG